MTVRPPSPRGVTVNKFKGISLLGSVAVIPPDYALDCLNVLPSNGGFLEKVRIPTELCDTGTGNGPSSFDDFQQATGVRQIIAGDRTKLFYITVPDFTVTPIDDQPEYGVNIWSMIELDNVMYMTNGEICLKWIGDTLELWGIDAPLNPPLVQTEFAMVQITKPGPGATPVICTIDGVGVDQCPVIVGETVTFSGMTTGANDPNGDHAVTGVNPDGTFTIAEPTWGVDETYTGGLMVVQGNNTIVVSGGYAYSYKNSVLGGESNVGPVTPVLPLANGTAIATADASSDNQVDTICWYKYLDGGGDLFLIGEFLLPDGLILRDASAPTDVDQSQFAPVYNAPPLNGRYATTFQGRVFIGNLDGAAQDIIYSGYERIFRGRPPECFPEFNRLRLAIGADDIRGIGVIQAGVVAFSKSNEMYMLRGVVEDIVTSAPVAFSAFLEQLPWNQGVASHWSIQATIRGLCFLGSDYNPMVFNGTAEPELLAPGIAPLLAGITTAVNENIRSAYFTYADRNWYCLLVPISQSLLLNRFIIIDLTEEPTVNIGAFVCDLSADAISVIEDGTGGRILVISSGGKLYKFHALSEAINGLIPAGEQTEAPTDDTDNVLAAYWRSGYFGGDAPYIDKLFRYIDLLTSIDGFSVILRVVSGNDIANPEILPIQQVVDGYADMSLKAKRVSVEIQFPPQDVSCTVLELVTNIIYLTANPRGGATRG